MATLGPQGSSKGEPHLPYSLTLDSAGHNDVADAGNSRIQVFSAQGVFLDTRGRHGSAHGEAVLSSGIAVDAAGRVYVADSGKHRIQVVAPQ